MVVLGGLICRAAWLAGRPLARTAFAIPAVKVWRREADESYFQTPGAPLAS